MIHGYRGYMDTEGIRGYRGYMDTWIQRIHEYKGYLDTEDTWIIIIIKIIIIIYNKGRSEKEIDMEPPDRRRCAAH